LASGALGPAASAAQRFPRAARLRKRFQFRFVRDRGRRVHTTSFLLLVAPSEVPGTRLGITVSRQVGHAVRRNRIKRLVRETFRQHRQLFPDQADVVVIAKNTCTVRGLADVQAEIHQAARALLRGGRR
jgi:ribonuclease P protein component